MRPVSSRAAVAAVVLLAAGLAACDSSGTGDVLLPAPVEPTVELVPLAVGNEWVFEVERTTYDLATGAENGTTVLPGRDTLRVVEAATVDGETWFRLAGFGAEGGWASMLEACYGGWLANRADGLYRRASLDAAPRRIVRFPGQAGDTYTDVPPFVLGEPGWHFEHLVVLKRTDYPVEIGGVETTGPMYTHTLTRLRVNGLDHGFGPSTPALRQIYGEGVGFAMLEAGVAATLPNREARLILRLNFRATEATLSAAT